MSDFNVLDSGARQVFETGAQRDIEDGKTQPGLISPLFLKRLGDHLAAGAQKYNQRNWEKGMDFDRIWRSTNRHLLQWVLGDRVEDHLAAAAFGLMELIHFEEMIKRGRLPASLNDLPQYTALERNDDAS